MQTHALRLLEFVIGAGVRDHDRHPVALLHLQRIRDTFADDNLLLTRFKVRPRAVLHKLWQRAQTRFLLRIHPFHLNGAQIRSALHQAGKVDVGCCSHNARHVFHFRERLAPVGPRLIHRLNFAVRNDRQNAVIQLTFKAVHRA
ncbi:hypothetical protein D3C72_1325090 [compost metagenome]